MKLFSKLDPYSGNRNDGNISNPTLPKPSWQTLNIVIIPPLTNITAPSSHPSKLVPPSLPFNPPYPSHLAPPHPSHLAPFLLFIPFPAFISPSIVLSPLSTNLIPSLLFPPPTLLLPFHQNLLTPIPAGVYLKTRIRWGGGQFDPPLNPMLYVQIWQMIHH